MKGFLAAAGRRWEYATNSFNKAISLDGALGQAWLGRGLVRLRNGERAGGRADLQTAAALEPNRSLLRSYLGKAFDNEKAVANAEKELRLAKALDERDPTPWLYSALVLRQELYYNDAVSELEKSVELNDNRQVYRSRLLLDEDRAVRNANLATIYRDAGMEDVSVREAARGVIADYANYSAHLFLAESLMRCATPHGSICAWRPPGSASCSWRTCWRRSAEGICRSTFHSRNIHDCSKRNGLDSVRFLKGEVTGNTGKWLRNLARWEILATRLIWIISTTRECE